MEVTVYSDNLSEDGSILIDRYIDYYMKHLQNRYEIDGATYLEGENASYAFCERMTPTLFQSPDFERWLKDDTLDSLHKEIKANGMQLCPLNFFTFCKYILTIIKEQYFILLKPTIQDTLEELDNVESISFKNKDGKNITTTNSELIKMVMDNIKAEKSGEYEKEKIVRIDEITDKVLIQSSFTYNVALFLKEYFKEYPRRSNCCMVSAKEQHLILYMLYFFGLAPVPLTDSRFRQLIAHYKKHRSNVSISIFPNVGVVPIEFIKYKDWHTGNINLDTLDALKEGETVRM